MNLQDQKYWKKSKSICSAEPNYLLQFEMRYPVVHTKVSENLEKKIFCLGFFQKNECWGNFMY